MAVSLRVPLLNPSFEPSFRHESKAAQMCAKSSHVVGLASAPTRTASPCGGRVKSSCVDPSQRSALPGLVAPNIHEDPLAPVDSTVDPGLGQQVETWLPCQQPPEGRGGPGVAAMCKTCIPLAFFLFAGRTCIPPADSAFFSLRLPFDHHGPVSKLFLFIL